MTLARNDSEGSRMSYEEFELKFRGRFLYFLTDAWAVRKEAPGQVGMVFDNHLKELKRLMVEVHGALKAPAPPPGQNGTGAQPAKGTAR